MRLKKVYAQGVTVRCYRRDIPICVLNAILSLNCKTIFDTRMRDILQSPQNRRIQMGQTFQLEEQVFL